MRAQQPPTPNRDRNQEDDRGQAKHLHGEIGDNRAPCSEQIMNWAARCVVEAWVLNRPSDQRERKGAAASEQSKPCQFRREADRNGTQRIGDMIQDCETGRRAHDVSLPPKTNWPDESM